MELWSSCQKILLTQCVPVAVCCQAECPEQAAWVVASPASHQHQKDVGQALYY